MPCSPWAASASLNRTGEPHQLVEPREGRAGVDRLAGQCDALAQVLRVSRGGDRARGVEDDCIFAGASGARKDVAEDSGVLARQAAAQLVSVTARDAEVEGVDRALAHGSVHDLADEVRPRRRELVDPPVAAPYE